MTFHAGPPGRRSSVVCLDQGARMLSETIALLRLLLRLMEAVDAHVVLGENGAFDRHLRAASIVVGVLPTTERLGQVGRDSGRRSCLAAAARRLLSVYGQVLETGRA